MVRNLEIGDASALNNVIDNEHIKTLVCENSIVYSGFDVEGGQAYFDHCLQLGDQVVLALDNGGDFSFVRYYQDDAGHHAVFRIYNNFIIDFYDCILDTVSGQIMVEDCFVYSLGTNLSNNVKYNMLYNLLLQTNPDSEARWLREAEELTASGNHKGAVSVLQAHEGELKDYPLFYQLYLVNLYQDNPKTFLSKLDAIKNRIDPRYLLFHQLHSHYTEGNVSGTETTAGQMIAYTGDDPIYLFLLGQAYQNHKQYDKAVECYQILDESMPIFWDLWQSELLCYKKLKNQEAYDQCLRRGEEAFGPTE
ncbi:MAG: hypothetical protein K6A41_03085 [Bacteroidales bacterium]|nr:hypothetical protein [Bacteroidales bacterium]